MSDVMKKELKRKAIHFLSFFYAAAYLIWGRGQALRVMGVLLLVEGGVEFARFFFPRFNNRLLALFGGVHRKEEAARLSGIFWTLLGSYLTMLIYPRSDVVLCSMGILIFADAGAAIVGVACRRVRHRIAPGKSWEGSTAFFLITLVICNYFFSPAAALIVAVVATGTELLPLPYNDNLWIPLASGFMLTIAA